MKTKTNEELKLAKINEEIRKLCPFCEHNKEAKDRLNRIAFLINSLGKEK